MRTHRVTIEAQTWRNVPPYPPVTMYRAHCKCGCVGMWYVYRENVPRECVNA